MFKTFVFESPETGLHSKCWVTGHLNNVWFLYNFTSSLSSVDTTDRSNCLEHELQIMQLRISLTVFEERKHSAEADKKVLRVCQLELN